MGKAIEQSQVNKPSVQKEALLPGLASSQSPGYRLLQPEIMFRYLVLIGSTTKFKLAMKIY